jgi:hypothetical protein
MVFNLHVGSVCVTQASCSLTVGTKTYLLMLQVRIQFLNHQHYSSFPPTIICYSVFWLKGWLTQPCPCKPTLLLMEQHSDIIKQDKCPALNCLHQELIIVKWQVLFWLNLSSARNGKRQCDAHDGPLIWVTLTLNNHWFCSVLLCWVSAPYKYMICFR